MTVAEYEVVGHAFRPGLLSADEVATLNNEVDRIIAAGERPGLVLEKDGRTLRSVFNPHLYSDPLARLVRHPRVLGVVEDMLGEPAYVFQLVVNNKAPFNGDMWYWHQDYPTYRADDHIAECRMVNVLIFLDDVSQFNGPLMVVPGSHLMDSEWPDESTQGTSYKIRYSGTGMIEAEVARGGIVAPTGPAGSVLFMHPNVLHGSGSNLSPWRRRLISLTYNAISNKATAPTSRSRDVVPDDSAVEALVALGDDCLLAGAARRGEGMTADTEADAARPVWAEIDLGAITHNIDVIRERAVRPVRLIVPVKANAYGHGAVAVSQHLERIGADAIATANVDEAIAIRTAGVRLPILMYASQLPAATTRLLAHGLTPTIADRAGLEAAAAAAGAEPVAVHVEVDAGFGRLGVRFDESAAFVAAAVAEQRLTLEGIYTHVPFSDQDGAAWARRRIAAFGALVGEIEATHGMRIPFAQVSASSAIVESIPDELNTIAPGHITYGISPMHGVDAEDVGFCQALRAIRAQVIHVGRREPGDDLATAAPDAVVRTAVLLFGIDNGYEFSPGASVLLHGTRCPVLSVTAEYTVVDTSALTDGAVGDVATIVGSDGTDSLSLHDVAALAGRSAGYWMMGFRRVPLRHDG